MWWLFTFIFNVHGWRWTTLQLMAPLIKKEFHGSKPPTALNLVNVNQILISDKFKHSDKGFKYFIGYQNDDIIRPLCIILPQMSGCVKYFENGG